MKPRAQRARRIGQVPIVAHALRGWREQAALSQMHLALSAGLSFEFLSKLERRLAKAMATPRALALVDAIVDACARTGHAVTRTEVFASITGMDALPAGLLGAGGRSGAPSFVFCTSEPLAVRFAAEVFVSMLVAKPTACVLLPTGRSAMAVFGAIVEQATRLPPLHRATLVVDTESFGVGPSHPASRVRAVRQALLEPLADAGIKVPSELYGPPSLLVDADDCRNLDQFLRLRRPDLHLVAAAPSGEMLGFDGASRRDMRQLIATRCQVVHLRRAALNYIDPGLPVRAVATVGMANLLESRVAVGLLFGPHKHSLVAQLAGGLDPAFPVTALREHPRLYVATDAEPLPAPGNSIVRSEFEARAAAAAIARGVQP